MKTIGTIFRKELRRVLFDKKMLMALFVMPVVIMLIIYGIMGLMVQNMQEDIESHRAQVMVYRAPQSWQDYLGALDIKDSAEITYTEEKKEFEQAKEDIRSGDLDFLIEFPEGFMNQVSEYQTGDAIPQVKTFYNPSEDYSSSAKSIFYEYLENYRSTLLYQRLGNLDDIQVFTVDSDNAQNVIQDEDKAGGKMLGMILPYMICMLLFAGVMSLGTDAIAGEKERGTMATMLVAPVKRSHIVYGKLLALMVLAALSALVYGISMLLSFPTFVKAMNENGMEFHISVSQTVLMLLLIVSLVFVYVAIITVCAVFAKNMKEASSYVMPAYMVVIVTGMMTMFVSGDTPVTSYFIPLYGSTMALRNILTQEITNVQVLYAIAVNLVLGALLAGVVTKAFDNERVMY
ncbi:MAG: ABC transporter permease [Lachnospiraceae bacterium]|nr:ABC transporter permease [Lachnospiraceae bacterium]